MSPTRREEIQAVLSTYQCGHDCEHGYTLAHRGGLVEKLANLLIMPAITRAQVEAVVRKHRFIFYEVKQEQTFINDLLGLLGGAVVEQARPAPSREALEKLLLADPHIVSCVHKTHTQDCVRHLRDRLLAWARGEAEKRWCEHCTFSPARDGHPAGYWYCWGTPDVVIPEIVARWACCPVLGCHKMRPT